MYNFINYHVRLSKNRKENGMYFYTCQVFILTPVIVFCIFMSRTVTFDTQALVLSFPSDPMLIPCPGPQLTLWMYTFEHPVCMETQSSPAELNRSYSSCLYICRLVEVSNFRICVYYCHLSSLNSLLYSMMGNLKNSLMKRFNRPIMVGLFLLD